MYKKLHITFRSGETIKFKKGEWDAHSRTVNQTNNSLKSLSQLEIYRQTRNALVTT